MGTRVTPKQWRDAFQVSEGQPPWPGPRPLTEADGSHALVGRDRDLSEFLGKIYASKLIHLHGASGVGKSSLLLAGMIPAMRREGYVVAVCRDWDIEPVENGEAFDAFLARALHHSLPEPDQAKFSADTDFFWDLSDLGGRGVIVLDQFEEFVRHHRGRRDQVFRWIADVFHNMDLHIVLSYRSDAKTLFDPINRNPKIINPKAQELLPVSDAAGSDLIRLAQSTSGQAPIEDAAADLVHAAWLAGRLVDQEGVGLLHLQALLYVLYLSAGQQTIRETHVHELFARSHVKDPAGIMSHVLEEAANRRLEMARSAAEAVGMDAYMVAGVARCLAEIVPRLSSGGFKVELEATSLALAVLHDDVEHCVDIIDGEREAFPSDESPRRQLIRHLVARFTSGAMGSVLAPDGGTLLAAGRDEVVAAADSSLRLGSQRWEAMRAVGDHGGVVAGPLSGLGPMDMLLEQVRRFSWALVWLNQLNLARISGEQGRSTSVTLVHDGFGEPLSRWSTDYLERHATWALWSLSLPQGESHDWANTAYQAELCGTAEEPRVHVNVGLRGNSLLNADLSNAVFVNCDFRGTLFLRCSFDAVTFLNCRLDGALFSECAVKARVNADTAVTDRHEAALDSDDDVLDAPVYLLRGHPDLAATMSAYRDDGSEGAFLFSPEPGLPATPTSDMQAGRAWQGAMRGLVIQGSRLSALTFRSTTFHDGASVVFARVRGSGLDLAELTVQDQSGDSTVSDPAFRFFGSALRHVAFTGQVDPRRATIEVDSCSVAQWWVGSGISGRMSISNSSVGQLWVDPGLTPASDGLGVPRFVAVCTNGSVVTNIVGAAATDQIAMGFTDSAAELPVAGQVAQARFRDRSARMDYARK